MGTGVVVGATANALEVMTDLGKVVVDVPGGLTAALYGQVAGLLSDEEKAVLALGVLQHELDLAAADFDRLRTLLSEAIGPSEEDWLPGLVDSVGFAVIAGTCREAIRADRATTPPPVVRVGVFATPRWDRRTRTFTYGDYRRTFRDKSVMVFAVLDALEDACWGPAHVIPYVHRYGLSAATYADVKCAVQYLKRHTPKSLKWVARNDGLVSCVPR